ncbi:MAG: branched-chain amino acid transaminase [Gemmatimonadetes bacterium]|nr:branched-chain amino acid transaminase [Gemmatimonadota bacterium]
MKRPQFAATRQIWKDGALVAWEEARIHVMSHVIHYGSSVFEGIRCYDGPEGSGLFRLEDHLRRFANSCRICRIPMPWEGDTLARACRTLVAANGLAAGYLRPIALRGYGAAGVDPSASPVETYVICWPWGAYLGDDARHTGIDACVSSWRRAAPDTFPLLAKAGANYLNAQLIKMEALANGFAEGIALDVHGLVSEGSGENIFLVERGVLSTPLAEGSLLPGITRDCVCVLARDLGIPVREEAIPRERLHTADEVFLTGTAAEITPVRSVDRIPVGEGRPGPITLLIRDRFMAIARGERADPWGWRTPIHAEAVLV